MIHLKETDRQSERAASITSHRSHFRSQAFHRARLSATSFRRSTSKIPIRSIHVYIQSGQDAPIWWTTLSIQRRSNCCPNASRVALLEYFRLSIHLETATVSRTTVFTRAALFSRTIDDREFTRVPIILNLRDACSLGKITALDTACSLLSVFSSYWERVTCYLSDAILRCANNIALN